MLKTALPSILVVLVAVFAPALQGRPTSTGEIAFIRPQRILAEATEARADLARFQATQQQKAADLRAKQKELATTAEQLAQATDSAARTRLQQLHQQQQTALQTSLVQAQTDLQAAQRQLQADLQVRLRPVLDDLLKGRNIQVVLNADTSIVWAAPGLDLTSELIQRLNAKPAAIPPKP